MSATPIRDFIIDWYERVWNQGETSYIYDTIAPDCQASGLSKAVYEGPAGFRKFYDLLTSTLADIQIDVKNVITTDEKMVAHVEISGTSKASGKQVKAAGNNITNVKDGKIVRLAFYQFKLPLCPESP